MSSPGFSDSDDGFAAAVRHESPQKISAAPHCVPNLPPPDGPADGDDSSDDRDDDGFEFAFVIEDPEAGPAITADEIFSNGQIRPVYPVFNRAFLLAETAEPREEKGTAPVLRGTLRRLLIEDREENSGPGSGSSSSSSLGPDELEGVPPGTYCVWAPRSSPVSQAGCKKSSSTGSSLRWRLRDLAVGRSHSDGKEKFVFLTAAQKKKGKGEATATAAAAKEASKEEEEGDKSRAKAKARKNANEPAAATARQIYYGSGRPAAGGVAPRRTFLPYKPDIVGFFANVNGLKRTHHPF